ncbi:hypothetical protein C2S51_007249 [Perilla frutescens var. frutescens]|nr:hypothetical protein C2S51_007249 [Perilla frutescens var. frutescens]
MRGQALGKGVVTRFDADTLKKGHQYVLFNCEAIARYNKQYHKVVKQAHPRVACRQLDRIHNESFADWFAQYVEGLQMAEKNSTSRDLQLLAGRPNFIGLKYEKFVVNGFRFHKKDVESMRNTQNYGVKFNKHMTKGSGYCCVAEVFKLIS